MIGQKISHYSILAGLGEGGMGEVYRAQDLQLGREVALKFLSAGKAADPLARKRLLKEAQAASRLNHPNIATIYEVNESETNPFLAMEVVHGETLKQMLQRGPLAPAQFLEIARQVADGLQEAHSAGVFHRDIKPANIMLDGKSRVKILDFGLAALTQSDRGSHETDEAFVTRSATQSNSGGTIPYMSPEQLRGEAATARSDIFSFGVVMYECLAGRRPFIGETAVDILHAILRTPHAPLRRAAPEVSEDWEKLVDGCLAKSTEHRWASMEEVKKALAKVGVPAAKPEKSVAVLYFENMSRAEEDEYFRDGMTEDVITELTKIKGLRVFPRSSVLAFRDKPLPVTQIGQLLSAAYILGGSFRRAGNRLRITAQLADAHTGHAVWAERYDREQEDVFTIQDEIAQNIARALRVMLSEQEKQEIARVPTREIQAYDYYLRGRQFFHQLRAQSLEFARQMFARAIVIDPGYARAYAGVGDCCSILYMWMDANEDNLKEAEAASRRAVELDPESAEAHASRGLAVSLGKNYEEAEKEFEMAIRLNPNLFETYYFYGRTCFAQSQYEKAAKLFEKASEANPNDYQAPSLKGLAYKAMGRIEEAREARRATLRLVEEYVALHPDDVRAVYFGALSYCEIGDRARALEWAERALAIDSDEPSVLYNIACVYSLLGEIEKAIDCLEKAFRNGFGHKEWIENDPDLGPLKEHPRFKSLMEQVQPRPARFKAN